jgi:hypothetical protein
MARKPRRRVTLGRSFQLVKEAAVDYPGNSGWQANVTGGMFLGLWWWLVGAPEGDEPSEEA